MILKKTTFNAMACIGYFFIIRVLTIISPEVFSNFSPNPAYITFARIIAVISLIAYLGLISFFITFLREFVHEHQIKLKRATLLVVIAYLLSLIAQVHSLIDFFNPNTSSQGGMVYFKIVIYWILAVILLIFFIVLYKEDFTTKQMKLKSSVSLAIIGFSVSLLAQSWGSVNYIYFLNFNRTINLLSGGLSTFVWIAIDAFYFFTFFSFLSSLHKSLPAHAESM